MACKYKDHNEITAQVACPICFEALISERDALIKVLESLRASNELGPSLAAMVDAALAKVPKKCALGIKNPTPEDCESNECGGCAC